jgi:hypothetical protein
LQVVSKKPNDRRWRQSGLRIHPEVKQGLKIAAALAGETMEGVLHKALVRELSERNVLPGDFGEDR